MSLLEPRNWTTTSPKYYNIGEIQVKDLKIAFENMIKIPKEEMNISLKVSQETQAVR